MKKSLLLLFSAIITAGYCQAEQLTPEQALARVRTAAGPQSRAVDMTRMSNLVYTPTTAQLHCSDIPTREISTPATCPTISRHGLKATNDR